MTSTYNLIVKGSFSFPLTLSSIPQTYTDLRLVVLARSTSSPNVYLQVNGITSAIYARNYIARDNSNYANYRESNQTGIEISGSYMSTNSNIFSHYEVDIYNYTGSTYKTCLIRTSNPALSTDNGGPGISTGLILETNAINSITLTGSSTASYYYLYGIKAE